jgi:hypothetical protein
MYARLVIFKVQSAHRGTEAQGAEIEPHTQFCFQSFVGSLDPDSNIVFVSTQRSGGVNYRSSKPKPAPNLK